MDELGVDVDGGGLEQVQGELGVLMAIDGLAYLINSFADLLAPGFALHLVPWIQLPALFGEGSLCLWLLIVGLDAERWKMRAAGGPAANIPPARPGTPAGHVRRP